MTAMNAFGRADGAWLLSDSAGFAADGTMLEQEPKVVAAERLGVAIGWNGSLPARVADTVGRWLDDQPDCHAALANLPALALHVEAECRECEPSDHPEGFRLTLAYWDADMERRRIALIASNCAIGATIGREPFRVRQVGSMITPKVDDAPWLDDFEPRRDAEHLAQKQREVRDGDGTIRVGGNFTAMRIHADGIEYFDVKSWPDRVGLRIGECPRFRALTLADLQARLAKW